VTKTKRKTDVLLPRKEYVNEHVRLVATLKHPTRAKLRAEVEEQSEDLRKAKAGKV
jgi:hypothetical protein